MAGAEFCKYKKGAIGDAGFDAHFDNELRADPRIEHANVHIDIAKTHLNYCIGTSGWAETRRRIDARMERADEEHPPQRIRANRVGFYSLNVKCPPELEDTEKEAEFFKKAYETACEVMSSVEGAFVHKDEKHEYTNTDTGEKVISRYEMHIFGAAITDDGRLNGKDAICPEKCKEINDKMQAMCLREFGISYQTGEGRKGKKKRTVEQVEAMGVVQEITDKVQYANDVLDTVQIATEEGRATLASLEQQISAKDDIISARDAVIKSQDAEIKAQRKELQEIKPYAKAIERLQNALETLLKQILALKPKEREREKKLFDWLEKHGKVTGKGIDEINAKADYIEQQSSRIESENSIESDDDFGMDLD